MVEEIFEAELSRGSVFKNRDALSPHYVPDSLPYREKQIEELSRRVAPILSGRKPENVFIYGKTGTGKTVVTKYVLRKLEKFAGERGVGVGSVYVNCRIHDTRHRVLVKIAQKLIPDENFAGLSSSYIYERILGALEERGEREIIVLDEIDKLKGVSDVIYSLNRANDELERASISVIGISNNVRFKESLDPRTKSTLCETEMVFPPYNAQELKRILEERAREGFVEGKITDSAVALAAAYAAQHSGDARYALMLLLRAGEIADKKGEVVDEKHVREARQKVEEDVILELVSTLPEQEKIALYTMAKMAVDRKGIKHFGGGDPVITSGDAFLAYKKTAESLGKTPVSDRWFREYISELEMYGIISAPPAGKGFRGNTRIIRFTMDPKRILAALEREVMG